MAIHIEPKDFLLAILRGDLYATTPLPLELCERLKPQCQESVIFEHPSSTAQFCNVYSPEGWKNELDRREYMVRLHLPPRRSVDEVKKELLAAATTGNMELVMKLKKELEGIKI